MPKQKAQAPKFQMPNSEWERLYPNRKPLVRRREFDPWAELPGPNPCFYFTVCKTFAVIAKDGKGVCRGCADNMWATMPYRAEYPMDNPGRAVYEALGQFAVRRGEMTMSLKRNNREAKGAGARVR